MTKVGPYKVIDNKRLLIPKDQESWIYFEWEWTGGRDHINIQIIFENDPDPKAPPTLRSEGKPTHASLIFRNWRNPLGLSTATPFQIGNTDAAEPLFLLAASWMIGDTRVIEIQLMTGGAK